MKKTIFSLMALALVFASCTKEAEESVIPSSEGNKFVVSATIPTTRMDYEENGGGYKATFRGNETMQLYCLNADNSVVSWTTLNIDSYSISEDGRKATFSAMNFSVPDGAEKIVSYINNGKVAFDKEKVSANLAAQNGFDDANNYHVIMGTAKASDVKENAKTSLVSIAYSYKTALLRFKLTYPEDVKMKANERVNITLSSTSGKIHNSLFVVNGELADTSKTGDIVFYSSQTDTSAHVITGYACIWAADDFKDARVDLEYDEISYGTLLSLKKETLEGGKVYGVTRTVTANPKPVTVFKNDDAGSMKFPYSGGEDVTNDWLSCKSGVVSWTANTTGAPRQATLNFKNGALCTVTQAVPADFKGSWSFTTKTFAGTGAYVSKADTYTFETVTFGEPRNTEALGAADGKTYTNNIGIKGLFFETTLDACVDIDYDAQTVRVGLFLDTRDGVGQEVNGKYAAYFPGLATKTATAWGKPWLYTETELGDPDYVWMWFKVSEDFNTITYLNRTTNDVELQTLTQYSDATMNQICGFGVVLSGTNVFNHSTVTAYAGFYQCNPNNQAGEFFTRK